MPETAATRRPLIAANWKMNKTLAETGAFFDAFIPGANELEGVDVVICPPATALVVAATRAEDAGHGVGVAAPEERLDGVAQLPGLGEQLQGGGVDLPLDGFGEHPHAG
ncbi:MAG TPA: triose-phosphate isomerase, partial [Solirubrobacterales bacterium]|nr:triose-phosphate isomerase [Solirubrobacterales bacterium]